MTPTPDTSARSAVSIISSGIKDGHVARNAGSGSKKSRIPRGLPRPEESATTYFGILHSPARAVLSRVVPLQ